MMREGDGLVRVEHERHRFGLFPRETWVRLLQEVGFTVSIERCRYDGGENAVAFIGVRGREVAGRE